MTAGRFSHTTMMQEALAKAQQGGQTIVTIKPKAKDTSKQRSTAESSNQTSDLIKHGLMHQIALAVASLNIPMTLVADRVKLTVDQLTQVTSMQPSNYPKFSIENLVGVLEALGYQANVSRGFHGATITLMTAEQQKEVKEDEAVQQSSKNLGWRLMTLYELCELSPRTKPENFTQADLNRWLVCFFDGDKLIRVLDRAVRGEQPTIPHFSTHQARQVHHDLTIAPPGCSSAAPEVYVARNDQGYLHTVKVEDV